MFYLLDSSEHSFKDVFKAIDSALGLSFDVDLSNKTLDNERIQSFKLTVKWD